MKAGFYRAFEDRYRGGQDIIKARLTVYLPFIVSVANELSDGIAIDLGCGRGEWLGLLKDQGIDAMGVDIDDGMLEACRMRGVQVVQQEAIAYLKEASSESASIVSAFHLAEHLEFSDLEELVSNALRVLKPGGLLIMETPNPDNLVVGTKSFYFDPTHIKPIPSELLNFVAEFSGFKRVKTLFLQEDTTLKNKVELTLSDVIIGVSPDYGIVAQKEGSQAMAALLNEAFDNDYGVTLNRLSARYDYGLLSRQQDLHVQMETLESELCAQMGTLGSELHVQMGTLGSELHVQMGALGSEFAQRLSDVLETTKSQAAEISALRNSLSWRITAPFRRSVTAGKSVARRVMSIPSMLIVMPKKSIFFVVNMTSTFTLNRPTLTAKTSRLLGHVPWLRSLAYRAMRKSRAQAHAAILAAESAVIAATDPELKAPVQNPMGINFDNKSPLEKWHS